MLVVPRTVSGLCKTRTHDTKGRGLKLAAIDHSLRRLHGQKPIGKLDKYGGGADR